MVARQKDVKTFFKKLRKRYSNDPAVLSRDRKILEHLVFAIFLENATFAQARAAFIELQRYFIDWNEIRVSTANEIASVIGNVPDPVRAGERLRRLLQWIFDNTYKFELEDYRAKGREEVLEFLKTVPFSTPFMNDYAVFFGFGGSNIPLDENCLRVLRLLGYVSVVDSKEVASCLDGAFKENEAREFFFALHEFAFELSQEKTKKEALKFLTAFDAAVSKRSDKPQVEPAFPSDPREIARLLSKREPRQKSSMPSSSEMLESEMDDDYDEKRDDGLFDDYGSDSSEIEEKDSVRNGASEEAFITSRSTSYVDNRPSAKEKTEKTKKKLSIPEPVSREEAADTLLSTVSEKTTGGKAGKSKSKAAVEAKTDSGAEKVSETRSPRGKKKDKSATNDAKAARVTKEKEVLPLEKASAVKKGTKETKKKIVEGSEKPSKKTVSVAKSDATSKTKGAAKKSEASSEKKNVSVGNGAAGSKSVKEPISSSKKVKKAAVKGEDISTRSRVAKKDEKSVSKELSSVRSKSKNAATSSKKSVKTASRSRKVTSEPPDKSNVDAGKKTAKRSIANSQVQKKSKGKK